MRRRQTHKSAITRDILIVDTLVRTGLRRAELANLRVGDLVFAGDHPALTVHAGKGAKDRVVPVIADRLERYVRGKAPADRVFGLGTKTLFGKIAFWVRAAGVPHIHTHSLRHKYGFDIVACGTRIDIIQHLMGHEDPKVTVGYLHVADQSMHDAVRALDRPVASRSGDGGGDTADRIAPFSYDKRDFTEE